MKNRRPDGWDKVRDLFAEANGGGDAGKAAALEDFEAGADAILEKLIEKGIKTDKFATNGRPIYLSNPRKKGWYVFIEK